MWPRFPQTKQPCPLFSLSFPAGASLESFPYIIINAVSARNAEWESSSMGTNSSSLVDAVRYDTLILVF